MARGIDCLDGYFSDRNRFSSVKGLINMRCVRRVIGHRKYAEDSVARRTLHNCGGIAMASVDPCPCFYPQSFCTAAMITVNVGQKDRACAFPVQPESSQFDLEFCRILLKAGIDKDEPFLRFYCVAGSGPQTTNQMDAGYDCCCRSVNHGDL